MLAPGISVSSTICCLSVQLQRRRRSTMITSARCIVPEVRLSLLLEPGHARHRASRAGSPSGYPTALASPAARLAGDIRTAAGAESELIKKERPGSTRPFPKGDEGEIMLTVYWFSYPCYRSVL